VVRGARRPLAAGRPRARRLLLHSCSPSASASASADLDRAHSASPSLSACDPSCPVCLSLLVVCLYGPRLLFDATQVSTTQLLSISKNSIHTLPILHPGPRAREAVKHAHRRRVFTSRFPDVKVLPAKPAPATSINCQTGFGGVLGGRDTAVHPCTNRTAGTPPAWPPPRPRVRRRQLKARSPATWPRSGPSRSPPASPTRGPPRHHGPARRWRCSAAGRAFLCTGRPRGRFRVRAPRPALARAPDGLRGRARWPVVRHAKKPTRGSFAVGVRY